MRVLALLVFIFLNLLPFTMAAVGPLTVHVVDASQSPVPNACVTELWPAYSESDVPGAVVNVTAQAASVVSRADSQGISHLPSRTATASGFRRMGDAVPRLISRLFGGKPPPAVRVTVLGPGYQGEALDLTSRTGIVSVITHTDVQSRKLRQRFTRTCVP